ncbi:peptidyl-tRNA hydrolase [Crocosphaera chwakensis CCY0110]|uniref:Peptidyl-tRNA hydrolase n=2 Tax=Crocosphaera TaxID=263510 RepID=A3IRQ9_9CHRO|nr:peptidyl-tRNA hydrolase [Crocosphaera chwakensis CCY0110]
MFIKGQVFNTLGVPTEDMVEWGIELLTLGYDSPNLRILAGLTDLNDRWEVTDYVNKTLKDFNISELTGKDAVIAYTSVILKEFLTRKISQERMLRQIEQLYLSWDYLKEIMDFYLLWNAKYDLSYGDVQYYWPDATRDNINRIIKEQAEMWLKNYS